MKKAEAIIVQMCRAGIGLSFAVLIVAVLTQVLTRTFGSSPVWTEELTRYALLYTAAFGAGLSLRSGELVNVDVLSESLPDRWSWLLRLLCAFLTLGLCAFLIGPAWKYVSIGAFQTSPAMSLRMDFVHFSVFLLLVILFLFSVLRIVAMVVFAEDGRPVQREDIS
ncbi:MAG: TRAP-type C4-dicarboxylate transport system permease small subunit [Granulosicoccus sp.]